MKKKILPLIGLSALLIILGAGLARRGAAQTSYGSAPDFAVTDLDGKSLALTQFKGKVLFLNFWASWCPPCRAEIPDFVDVYREFGPKGLAIIGVSLDTKERSAIVSFVKDFKINYPVVLETRRQTEKLIDDFKPGQFIPTTFIIDKQGRIRDKIVRSMDREEMVRYFNRLIAE